MFYTIFSAQASSDFIVDSNPSGSGVIYSLTKEASSYPSNILVPWGALIREVEFFITDTYQYSNHRYAKVMHTEFAEDMGARFTTSGASASTNVLEELTKYLYNDRKFYMNDSGIPIRIKGDGNDSGYSAGSVFRILSGAWIQLIVSWDTPIQPRQRASGVWEKRLFWDRKNAVFYRTHAHQKVGGVWK